MEQTPLDLLKQGVLPYREILRRNAGKYGATATEIDDILQDVFLAAWGMIAKGEEVRSWKAWLVTVSRNTTLAVVRKRQRAHRYQEKVRVQEIERAEAGTQDPEMKLLAKEQLLATSERLSRLADSEKGFLFVVLNSGRTRDQAAKYYGVSTRTIRRRLARIKEKVHGRD